MDSPRKKVAYDPDQDPEEKRVLRKRYRVLLKDDEGISFRSPPTGGEEDDPRAHFR
jgi:hypothetical protein